MCAWYYHTLTEVKRRESLIVHPCDATPSACRPIIASTIRKLSAPR